MRKLVLAIVILIATLPVALMAQAVATSKVGWDQSAPTLADAQGYTYNLYADGSTTAQVLTATCTGTVSPFSCEAPFPAFTPGNHTLTLSAKNIAGESAKTAPFAFTFIVTPATPTGLRIK